MIGHLENKASAAVFSDYLYVNGISNVVETEKDGYSIWIHSEDELAKARDFLTGYQRNPDDPKYAQHSREAQERKQREVQEERAAEKRHFDRDRIFKTRSWGGFGPVTLLLILMSVITTLAMSYEWAPQFFEAFFFYSNQLRNAPEIARGELWRLITPIFIHARLTPPFDNSLAFLHLPFNMLWLYDLGGMIEQRRGTWRLLLLVLVIAAISNSAQYHFTLGSFGGMSGVVYGLLGYAWLKGRLDPNSGLFVHSQTMTMMMVWFFLCLFGFIPRVANVAHGAGLAVGLIWGLVSSMISNSRRP
jgi:GlpG protein